MNETEFYEYEKTMTVNPFNDDYWHTELDWYGVQEVAAINGSARLVFDCPSGRLDDYLNKNFRDMDRQVPRLLIDGHTWMSLTPMEIQSAALALHRAKGHVITAGLGLGYFALRAAAKDCVTKVTVFEINEHVRDWFLAAFGHRPELDKIEIKIGDARKLLQGWEADFVFMDIYQSLLPDEVITDARAFQRKNKFKRYLFWGAEKVVMSALQQKIISKRNVPLVLGHDMLSYFRWWMRTPVSEDNPEMMLCDLYDDHIDAPFVRRAIRTMQWPY